jgi:hypothetical protein
LLCFCCVCIPGLLAKEVQQLAALQRRSRHGGAHACKREETRPLTSTASCSSEAERARQSAGRRVTKPRSCCRKVGVLQSVQQALSWAAIR